MYGRFDRASRNRGAVFLSTFLFAPPELHETGTVLKHWNRATEYVKTGYVHDLVSEIYALVCRQKLRINATWKIFGTGKNHIMENNTCCY